MTAIKKTFAHHHPSEEGLGKIRILRVAFSQMQELIEGMAPSSRERSVALTHLETAAMWATKAVVLNDPESVAEEST